MNNEQNVVDQSQPFNYGVVDTATTTYLKQNAMDTRGLLKRTTEDIIKVGQNLLEAKTRLPHGQFIPWVKAELGMSQSTAWRFMQIAQGKNIKKSFTVNDLPLQIAASPEKPMEEMSQEDKEAWRALFHIIRDWDKTFDAMLSAFYNRCQQLERMCKNLEEDSCLSLMSEEINEYVQKSLSKQGHQVRTAL